MVVYKVKNISHNLKHGKIEGDEREHEEGGVGVRYLRPISRGINVHNKVI